MSEKQLTGYPSIDKPWLKYYSEEAINSAPFEGTIYRNIYENNKDHLNDIALLFFGKKVSYKLLFKKIDETAKAFVSVGVKNGDNVAICMPAVPETIYAVLALNKLGANANLLNPTFSENQLRNLINETNARILIVLNELFERVENIIEDTCIEYVISCPTINSLNIIYKSIKHIKTPCNTISWNKFILGGKQTIYKEIKYIKNKPAIMVYSSGTTGVSKAIVLTNDGINATIQLYDLKTHNITRQDRYFCQIPLWFSTGISVTCLVPLQKGLTVILEPVYDFSLFEKEIVKYKPQYIITAVSLLNYLKENRYQDESYKLFKVIAVGGEGVPQNTEEQLNIWLSDNACKLKLQKGYGMCECGGIVTNTIPNNNLIGSAGIPMPQVTVSVFDLVSGKELSYNHRGEIRVFTPCRMLKYYKHNKETSERLIHDAAGNVWVSTGDMGSIDENGNLFVYGRIADSYIDDQKNTVYLFDIDNTILENSKVRQCKTVTSTINGFLTHVCHIAIEKGTDEKFVIQAINNHCAKCLPNYYIPRYFKIYRDALPVASSGKLDIRKMKNDMNDLIEI